MNNFDLLTLISDKVCKGCSAKEKLDAYRFLSSYFVNLEKESLIAMARRCGGKHGGKQSNMHLT